MIHFVYRVVNIINGKSYIGITNNIHRRWVKHKWNAKASTYSTRFYSSMRSHGIENFIIEVLYCSLFRDDVREKETNFIREYKSTDKSFGYNMTEGGEETACTPEVRAKIAAANRGKILTAEHRAKISAGGKGRIVTAETRKKMGKATKNSVAAIAHRKKIQDSCNKVRVISTPEGIEVVHNLKQFCINNNFPVKSVRKAFNNHIKNKTDKQYKNKFYCLGVL